MLIPIGVAAGKGMTTHIAWIPARYYNWDYLLSKHSSKCLMTASRVSKTRGFCEGIYQ